MCGADSDHGGGRRGAQKCFFHTVPLVQKVNPGASSTRRVQNAVAPHSDPALHRFFWVGDTGVPAKAKSDCFFGLAGSVQQQAAKISIKRREITGLRIRMNYGALDSTGRPDVHRNDLVM
jgi:hypothetical protein